LYVNRLTGQVQSVTGKWRFEGIESDLVVSRFVVDVGSSSSLDKVNSSMGQVRGSITRPPSDFFRYISWNIGIGQGVFLPKAELNFGDVQKRSNCQNK
jgi:hypothetical protein